MEIDLKIHFLIRRLTYHIEKNGNVINEEIMEVLNQLQESEIEDT